MWPVIKSQNLRNSVFGVSAVFKGLAWEYSSTIIRKMIEFVSTTLYNGFYYSIQLIFLPFMLYFVQSCTGVWQS